MPIVVPTPVSLNLPPIARLLWVLPPEVGGIIEDGHGNHFLGIVAGGPGLMGSIKLPLSNFTEFNNNQKGRTTHVWAAEVGSPTEIRWSGRDNGAKGEYEWRPGYDQPLFSPEHRSF